MILEHKNYFQWRKPTDFMHKKRHFRAVSSEKFSCGEIFALMYSYMVRTWILLSVHLIAEDWSI